MILSSNTLNFVPPWRKKYQLSEGSLVVPSSHIPTKNIQIAGKQSLKLFAEKCFSSCSSEKEKDLMEKALKEKLSCLSQDAIQSNDWSKEPIPALRNIFSEEPVIKRHRISTSDINQSTTQQSSVVGISTSLEKAYFRLTSEPDPSSVRPEYILKQSLEFVLSKWEKEKNVPYIIEQLKSIRQDIAIQSIKNEFTIQVYETNCQIALKCDEFNELIQCLGQLLSLYEAYPSNIKDEYICYYMLYMLYVQNYPEFNILLRRNTRKNKSLIFCEFVSRAIYEKNSFNILQALESCPYNSSLILNNIRAKFFSDNMNIFMRAIKTSQDEQTFKSMFSVS